MLELDEYDAVYFYNKDFSKAALEDIDKYSAIYYWATEGDDEELFVMVVNDAVEGEVTRMRDDSITVEGKKYDRADDAIASLNEGKSYKKWNATEVVKDLIGEEVVAVLDLNGDVVAVIGKADVTSDTLYGIVTWAESGRTSVLSIFGADGKVVDYELEKRTEIGDLAHENYMEKFGDGLKYAIVSFELNSDGEIADGTLKIVEVTNGAPIIDDAISDVAFEQDFDKDADKAYMKGAAGRAYADEDTIIIQAIDDDELDPGIIDFDDFEKMDFKGAKAVVFGKKDKTAKMIVFVENDFDAVQKDVYFGIVTDNAWRVGSTWEVEIDVFEDGKGDYTLKTAADRDDIFAKGSLVAFRLDSNDKVFATVYRQLDGTMDVSNPVDEEDMVTGYVYDVDGSYIKVGLDGSSTKVYKVKSGAVIYVTKEDGTKLDGTLRLSRVDNGKEVVLLLDKDEEVAAMLVIR